MIGIFVCSWCCFFPICKYLETFKRFVEERTLSLTCWWGYSLKFPHTTDTSLPDASLCMPFQTHYHILLLFLILFPFDFFVLFETCQHENLCNVSMQIISQSKWVEGKNLILKFLVCHLFFINASLNKTKYYLKNGFCKFKVQECYVRAPIPQVIFPLPVLLRLNIVTRW